MTKKTKVSRFLDPEEILNQTDVQKGYIVADFGCGNGYYSIAAARAVGGNGKVYSVDILEKCLSNTVSQARLQGLHNISTRQCDLEKIGDCDVENTSCDLVIVSNILHLTNLDSNVLREAYRVLKTRGKILIVEWKKDSPLGPPQGDRVDQTEVKHALEQLGFRPVKELEAGAFHFALVYEK